MGSGVRTCALPIYGRVAEAGRCDASACVVPLPDGQALSLVTDASAFAEDCARADVIVTPLRAPPSCAAGPGRCREVAGGLRRNRLEAPTSSGSAKAGASCAATGCCSASR